MDNAERELYQVFTTNPNHVTIEDDLNFELYHSETHNCGEDSCKTCKFEGASSCAISKEGWPKLYKALTEYFSEHYPEKLI